MSGLAGGLVFTGIIEAQAKVLSNDRIGDATRLMVVSPFEQVEPGESIAVNGVCLTVLPSIRGELHFDVSPETLHVTSLVDLRADSFVNLERAMAATNRFGGHYVSGHVDAKAQVKSIKSTHDFIEMTLCGFTQQALFYLIPKGSITVDGVSLTINAVSDQTITLMLIPHTLLKTTLGSYKAGQCVNIEFDYLTRIVAHQLQISGKLNYEVEL